MTTSFALTQKEKQLEKRQKKVFYLFMQRFEKVFDKFQVAGYHITNMKDLSLEQLLEVKKQLDRDYQTHTAAITTLIEWAKKRNGDNPLKEVVIEKGNKVDFILSNIYEATCLAVEKSAKPFELQEIFETVKSLYTRRPVKKSAVSTALSRLREEGKIVTVKPGRGASPGTYKKTTKP
jgi:hypothetical protein